MLTIFIRAILLYCFLVLAMRGMGKRQMGQFQPYEFVMVMLVANLVAAPMSDVAIPLLQGLLPMAGLYIVHGVIKMLCMYSDRLRAIISGKPSLIISKGILQRGELKRLALTLSDVLEGLRLAGIRDPAEVGTAVMEANGSISAFPRSSCRGPSTSEMGIDAGYEGIPMVLVMDGRVQIHNLTSAQLTEEWLIGELSAQEMTVKDVFIMSVDTQGRMTIQDKAGDLRQYQAIPSGEVKW